MLVRNIHHQEVLHDRVAQMPIGVTVGEIRSGTQLLRCYAPPQDVRADIRKALLLLHVNADVIAMNVRRKLFVLGGIERKAKPILQCGQERFRRPAMLQEQKFKARTLAVLAEYFPFTKKLRHTAYHWDNQLPLYENVHTNDTMRN